MLKRLLKSAIYMIGALILVVIVQQLIFNPIIQPILVSISPIFSDEFISFTERSRRTLTPSGLALAATTFIIFMLFMLVKWFFVEPYILGETVEDYNEPIQADESIYSDDGELLYDPDEHDNSENN